MHLALIWLIAFLSGAAPGNHKESFITLEIRKLLPLLELTLEPEKKLSCPKINDTFLILDNNIIQDNKQVCEVKAS